MHTFTRVRWIIKGLYLISGLFVFVAIINLPSLLYPSVLWVYIGLGVFVPLSFSFSLHVMVKDTEEAIHRLKHDVNKPSVD